MTRIIRNMTRKTIATLAVTGLAGLSAAGALYAQSGAAQERGEMHGMMGMMSMMQNCPMMGAMTQGPQSALEHRQELGLADTQVRQLETLQKSTEQSRTQTMRTMRTLHPEIAAAVTDDRFDEGAARAALDRMGDLHTEMVISALRTRHEVRGILTPEQREELAKLGAAMMGMGGMMDMMQMMGEGTMEACPMMHEMMNGTMQGMHGGMMGGGTDRSKPQRPDSMSHGESRGTNWGNAAPNAHAPLAAAAPAGSRGDEIRELKERLALLEARETSSPARLP